MISLRKQNGGSQASRFFPRCWDLGVHASFAHELRGKTIPPKTTEPSGDRTNTKGRLLNPGRKHRCTALKSAAPTA